MISSNDPGACCAHHKQQALHPVWEIFQRFLSPFLRQFVAGLNALERKLLLDIIQCRTQKQGGHKHRCDDCGYCHFNWHSCNNRMCPLCGALKTARWIAGILEKSLPVDYYMITFTLPEQLNFLCRRCPEQFYPIFFQCAAQAIKDILADPKHAGIEAGFFGMFQSWQQNLLIHPHIHFLLPAVGIALTGKKKGKVKRIAYKKRKKWLVYGDVFAKHLKTLLLQALKEEALISPKLKSQLWTISFNCDVQNFGDGVNAVKYLGGYVYKGPITDKRIRHITDTHVTFTVKNREAKTIEEIEITGTEFIRRYLMHALPHGFHRIRYFGFLHNTAGKTFKRIRNYLGRFPKKDQKKVFEALLQTVARTTAQDGYRCPRCKKPMTFIGTVPRAPPNYRLIQGIYYDYAIHTGKSA